MQSTYRLRRKKTVTCEPYLILESFFGQFSIRKGFLQIKKEDPDEEVAV